MKLGSAHLSKREQHKQREASVAIITRTKDRSILLSRCIDTVLGQEYSDWVHVIVNDGGDKNTLDALTHRYDKKYDGRLLILHNDASVGMEAAANIGVRSTSSRFVVVLDDDDAWHPTYLSKMVAALEQPEFPDVKGVICHTEIVYERIDGNMVIEEGRADFNSWVDYADLIRLVAWNRFTPVSFMFERSAFDTVGMFNEALPVCGDWDFNIRFLAKFEISVVREKLAFYRQRRGAQNNYGNTVHLGRDDHRKYRIRLSNKWIRDGLLNGTVGFGELFILSNIIEYHEEYGQLRRRWERRLDRRLNRRPMRDFLRKARRWLPQILFRAK